jgi:hypothetical protein
MNTTELQEIQMYNANRKMHEDQHHKVPLRIDHFFPLIIIFGSGLLTGTFVVVIVMGFVK